jgi:hypothetical protein
MTIEDREGIQTTEVLTADAFLDVLSPRNERWSAPDDFIYRGQANANWLLQPGANRKGREPFKDLSLIGDPWAAAPELRWPERSQLVKEVVKHFREGLNRSGLVVPVAFPVSPDEEERTHSGEYLPRKEWPVMALAQHHGLPTHFLDWSRRARVAAYFAAYDARNPETKGLDSHLAVWGAVRWKPNESLLHRADPDRVKAIIARLKVKTLFPPQFYAPPPASNPNLHAQAGLFTIYSSEEDFPLEWYYARSAEAHDGMVWMHRITLPIEEAGTLLRLLADEGVTGASLFPNADGVVRAMRERKFWDTTHL